MKYIIDPYLFSFHEEMGNEELDAYLSTIVDMDKWWQSHKDEMYVQSDISDLLYEHGIYPLVDKLSPLLERYNSEVDYRDITRMLNRFLEHTNFIDEGCTSLCIDKTGEVLETGISAEMQKRPDAFRSSFSNLLWYVFCMQREQGEEPDNYAVFTKDIDQRVDVEYTYETIDLEKDADNPIPGDAKTTIKCHSSIHAFECDADTPYLMWHHSTSKSDLDFGLRCALMQEDGLSSIDEVSKTYIFMLQDSFYEDFCCNHYANRPKDIRSAQESIIKAIKNIRHGKEHPKRKGEGGNEEYLIHGNYMGMRKNATTSIKIQYWKWHPRYRFATINEHDYFDLPWED